MALFRVQSSFMLYSCSFFCSKSKKMIQTAAMRNKYSNKYLYNKDIYQEGAGIFLKKINCMQIQVQPLHHPATMLRSYFNRYCDAQLIPDTIPIVTF